MNSLATKLTIHDTTKVNKEKETIATEQQEYAIVDETKS